MAYWLDDETVRIGAQQGITQELKGYAGELRAPLPLLDGTRETDDLLRSAGHALPTLTSAQLQDGIALLDDSGLLEDASLYDHLPGRLHANQTFFAAAAANTSSPSNVAQRRISDSPVLFLGLGGGGSASLPQLLALGVKELTIVDYDVVELPQYRALMSPERAGKTAALAGSIGTVMEWRRESGCPTCGERDARYDHIFEIAPL